MISQFLKFNKTIYPQKSTLDRRDYPKDHASDLDNARGESLV